MTEHGAGPGWLTPTVAVRLDGSQRFAGVDATVADFWRWACSDLRDNTTRGMLAELLVAKAVGDQRPLRIGLDNFDVVAPDGTTNRGRQAAQNGARRFRARVPAGVGAQGRGPGARGRGR